jgi:hypothetical protein
MPCAFKGAPNLLAAAALLSLLRVPVTAAEPPEVGPARTAPVEAQFRGCEAAGYCRFWLESADAYAQTLHRVRPQGVVPAHGDNAAAVRDRLNALLASMIHQHKQILLYALRELEDGTFTARVTANGADVASDPQLLELRAKHGSTTR